MPLRRVWHSSLCCLPLGSQRQESDSLWAFCSSGWTHPAPAGFPSLLQPLAIWVALRCSGSSMSISFLYRQAQNWMQHCRSCLTIARWRGLISLIDLLAMLLLIWVNICCYMWPKVWMAHFTAGHSAYSCSILCPPGCPGLLLQSCFPTTWGLGCNAV